MFIFSSIKFYINVLDKEKERRQSNESYLFI